MSVASQLQPLNNQAEEKWDRWRDDDDDDDVDEWSGPYRILRMVDDVALFRKYKFSFCSGWAEVGANCNRGRNSGPGERCWNTCDKKKKNLIFARSTLNIGHWSLFSGMEEALKCQAKMCVLLFLKSKRCFFFLNTRVFSKRMLLCNVITCVMAPASYVIWHDRLTNDFMCVHAVGLIKYTYSSCNIFF